MRCKQRLRLAGIVALSAAAGTLAAGTVGLGMDADNSFPVGMTEVGTTEVRADPSLRFAPQIRLDLRAAAGMIESIAAAADSEGNLYVAWCAADEVPGIWCARLSRGERSFSAPVAVSDEARDPALVIDDEGRLILAYVSNDSLIEAVVSEDGGNHFSEPLQIEGARSSKKEHPALAASEGQVYVAWRDLVDGEATVMVARGSLANGLFQRPVGLGWNADEYGSLVASPQGPVHLVWETNGRIRHTSSRDGGRTFIATLLPSEGTDAGQPDIALSPDGSLLVCWNRDGTIFLSRRSPNSASFSAPVRVSDEAPSLAAGPGPAQLAADEEDRVFVAWTSLWGTDRDITIDCSLDGGLSFGTDQRPGERSQNLADQVLPALAVGPDGMVYVAWIDCSRAEGQCTYPTASCHEICLTYAALGDTTPPGAPADLRVYQKTDHSIALRWIAPGDDGTEGRAARYDIRHSTDPIDEQSWETADRWSEPPEPSEAGLADSMTVRGLDPGTQYFFALRAADEPGRWSPLSPVVVDTTVALTAALSSFEAQWNGDRVHLTWSVGTGKSTSYFFVQRSSRAACPASERVALNTTPLTGTENYYLPDTTAIPGRTYFYWLREVVPSQAVFYHGPLSVSVPTAAPEIGLTNQPNPFYTTTIISYSIPDFPLSRAHEVQRTPGLPVGGPESSHGPQHVSLRIFNLQGQLIRTLIDEPQDPGRYEYGWNGTAESGKSVGAGVYFYRLEIDEHVESGRMIYIK